NSRIFLSKSNSGRLSRIRTVITNSGAFIPAINYREFPLYVLNRLPWIVKAQKNILVVFEYFFWQPVLTVPLTFPLPKLSMG
ncbi:MAG: hypothetical protein ACLP29_15800, partial [Dissulfurispiraceae bacterium]